jgi:uncharacterized protein YlxW (UPF0749 family)
VRRVRVVASTSFVAADAGGIAVDGTELRAPYRFVVIGDPATLTSALRIPGGVVDNVEQFGGQARIVRQGRGRGDRLATARAASLRSPDALTGPTPVRREARP